MLKGAQYMSIAEELEKHASEELQHALIIAKQIDYLGGTPTVTPKPVKTSEKAEEMLRFDLDNENETIRNYRERVRQCEALGEYAMAEHIREILDAGAGAPDRPGHGAGRGPAAAELRGDVSDLLGPKDEGPRRSRELDHVLSQPLREINLRALARRDR